LERCDRVQGVQGEQSDRGVSGIIPAGVKADQNQGAAVYMRL